MWRFLCLFAAQIVALCALAAPAGENLPGTASLSPEEQQWLKAHPIIKLAPDPNFRPIEYFDKKGDYQGVAADVIRLLEKKLGISITVVHLKNWDEVLEKFKSHEVDLLGALVKTSNREQFMLFTESTVSVSGGIFSRMGTRGNLTLKDFKGKTVAVVSKNAAEDILKQRYPEIKVVTVPDVIVGLTEASMGRVDAFVENMACATFYSQEAGITNLHMVGKTDFDYEWRIGVRKDWPQLQGILNKGLATIGKEERDGIIQRWIHVESMRWHPTKAFIVGVLASCLGGLLLIVMSRNIFLRKTVNKRTVSLRRELKERQKAERALRAMTEQLEERVRDRTSKLEKEIGERAKSEQAAISNEHRFKALFQNAADSIYIIDMPGRILAVNDQACKEMGYSRDELVEMHISDIDVIFDEPAKVSAKLRDLGAKESMAFETVQRRKDGSLMQAEVNVRGMDYEGQPAFLGVVRNVTARKRAEEARAHLASVVESSDDAILSESLDGMLLSWNLGAEHMYGYAAQEVIGKPVSILVPPDRLVELKAILASMRRGVPISRLETTRVAKDGQRIEVALSVSPLKDALGKSIGSCVIARDITERKRAEEALRENEERYRLLFEGITDGAFVHEIMDDAMPGQFLVVNETLCQRLGYAREELLRLRVFDIDAPESTVDPRAITARLKRDNKALFEQTHVAKDGRRIPVEINAQMIRMQGREVIFSVARDITERKRAEEALRESQSLYHSFVEQLPNALFRKDAEGRFVMVNPLFCRLKGMKAEDFLGKKALEVLAFDSASQGGNEQALKYAAQGEEIHERVMQTGKLVETEEEYPNADGGKTFLHVVRMPVFSPDGKVIGSQGILFDVTARKRAEEALRESQSLYHSFIEQLPNAVFRKDGQGRYVMVNPEFCRIKGMKAADFIGKKPVEVASGDVARQSGDEQAIKYAAQGEEAHERVMRTGKLVEAEEEYPGADGGKLFMHVVRMPVFGPDGKVIGSQGIQFDVTEIKRAEEALRESQSLYRSFVEQLPNAVFRKDAQGRFVMVNSQFCRFRGMKTEDFLGKTALEVLASKTARHGGNEQALKYAAQGAEAHKLVMRTGKLVEVEEEYPGADGGKVFMHVVRMPVFDPNGKIIGSQGILFDVTERKRAEEALLESDAFRKRVFDSSRVPIVVMDGETLRYIDCNPAAVAIYRSPSVVETLGKTLTDVSAPMQYDGASSPKKIRFYADKALAEGMVVFEWRHQRPNGEIWDAEIHLMSFQSGQRRLLQFTLQDITERKRAERQLKQERDFTNAVLDSVPGLLYLYDEDARLVRWNKQHEDMTGYSAAEVATMRVFDWFGGREPDTSKIAQMVQDVLENGHADAEADLITKDGRAIPFYFTGVKLVIAGRLYATGIGIDLTERRRAEAALRESEQKFRAVVENAQAIVFILDRQGVFQLAEGRELAKLGLKPGQLVGQSAFDFYKDAPSVMESIQKALAGESLTRVINELPEAMFDTIYSPYQDAQGQVVGVIGVAIDVTERKRAEEEQKKLHAQLIQAHKMESVGRLAGGVAHDFNNMLSVILGHAELVLDSLAPASPLVANLREIQAAAQRSADLTRQLLAFARKQAIAPKTLDLNDAIEGMLNMLRRLIGEDIDVAWMPGRDLWRVKIDPAQVNQILANLLVNARDAIGGVGKVTIDTRNVVFDEAYCARHAEAAPSEHVMLAVSDDGCGMDEETQAHVFEPFFTTKEIGQGAGLGLATVYGIVKQNDGFINIYSEPGHGTTFKIYLPRHADEAIPVPAAIPAQEIAGGLETILLVEDEPMISSVTKTFLEGLGYEMLTADAPTKALLLAKERAYKIDLLITDVVMPEMNGRDLAKQLVSLCPGLKCLFMSGYTANIIAHRGVLEEGVHFLQKPFALKDLAAKTREALDRGGEPGEG
jgi:PAS domain S-box-containing protein